MIDEAAQLVLQRAERVGGAARWFAARRLTAAGGATGGAGRQPLGDMVDGGELGEKRRGRRRAGLRRAGVRLAEQRRAAPVPGLDAVENARAVRRIDAAAAGAREADRHRAFEARDIRARTAERARRRIPRRRFRRMAEAPADEAEAADQKRERHRDQRHARTRHAAQTLAQLLDLAAQGRPPPILERGPYVGWPSAGFTLQAPRDRPDLGRVDIRHHSPESY